MLLLNSLIVRQNFIRKNKSVSLSTKINYED